MNGRALVGSVAGYAGVRAALVEVLGRSGGDLVGENGWEGALSGAGTDGGAASSSLEAASAAILRVANRTVSGGDGYDAATRLVVPEGAARALGLGGVAADNNSAAASSAASGPDGPPAVLLLADSRGAPPVELEIDAGPWQEAEGRQGRAELSRTPLLPLLPPSVDPDAFLAADAATRGWRVGVRVEVRATTLYRLVCEDGVGSLGEGEGEGEGGLAPAGEDGMRPLARVRTTYRQRLGVRLVAGAGGEVRVSVVPAGGGGEVELEVE